MNKLFLVFVIFFTVEVNGQPFPLDTFFLSELPFESLKINVCDSLYSITRTNTRNGERNNVFMVKPSSIDTLNIKQGGQPLMYGGNFYFDYNYREKTRTVWSYAKGLHFDKFDHVFSIDVGGEYIFQITGSSFDEYQLEYFNPVIKESTPIIQLKNLPLPNSLKFPIRKDWGLSSPLIINKESIIIGATYYLNEAGVDFYFHHNNDTITPIDNILSESRPYSDYSIISIDRTFVVIPGKNNPTLFTDNIVFIGEILSRQPICGLNIQKGKFTGYFLSAHLDNDYYATFFYELNPTLELAMYKAFHDGILTQQDIKGLSKKELGILRNLLFAKHNYQFESLFYHAYFKTLDFYIQLGRDSRTKNINHLLTEADKANLALIRAAEARVKE